MLFRFLQQQAGIVEQLRRAMALLDQLVMQPQRLGGLAALQSDAGKAAQGTAFATPVGPACRLCERVGCLARAEPPVTRPLGLDEMVTGLSAFDFQG